MILAFSISGISFYIKVDDERNIFGFGPGAKSWIPFSDMFSSREDLAKVIIVKRVILEKNSLHEVKEYIINEFDGRDGVVFDCEVSEESFEGVVGV